MSILDRIMGSIADRLFPCIGVKMDFPTEETMTAFINAYSETYGELFELYYLEDYSIRFTCKPTMYARLCAAKREFPVLVEKISLVK